MSKASEKGSGIASIIDQAKRAEDFGYTGCFIPDHYIFEEIGNIRVDQPTYDPFMTLAVIAQHTKAMKLVTHVACMLFRHPAMHARLFAQLDEASGGRAIAGVGAGWTKVEFERMGIEFPEVSERLEIMDECVAIMRGLWTEESFSFDGRHFQLKDAPCLPKPAQAGGPPIMLGGSGKGILRRAGRYADIIHMVPQTGRQGTTTPAEIAKLTDDTVAAKLAIVREEARKAGRAEDSVKFATTVFSLTFTESPAKSVETAEFMASLFGMEPAVVRRHPVVLIGTPDEMVEELTRRRETHGLALMGLHAGNDAQLERFGREVLAKLV
jgi:probable F420-dependent oxidoreductase